MNDDKAKHVAELIKGTTEIFVNAAKRTLYVAQGMQSTEVDATMREAFARELGEWSEAALGLVEMLRSNGGEIGKWLKQNENRN